MSKDNVTKTLENISNGNSQLFIQYVQNITLFVEKIKKLVDENYDNIWELFVHSRKGTQYKTDQNFYFLWSMLQNITVDEIEAQRNYIFDTVTSKFSIIQKTPESLTIEKFIEEIKIVLNKNQPQCESNTSTLVLLSLFFNEVRKVSDIVHRE